MYTMFVKLVYTEYSGLSGRSSWSTCMSYATCPTNGVCFDNMGFSLNTMRQSSRWYTHTCTPCMYMHSHTIHIQIHIYADMRTYTDCTCRYAHTHTHTHSHKNKPTHYRNYLTVGISDNFSNGDISIQHTVRYLETQDLLTLNSPIITTEQ